MKMAEVSELSDSDLRKKLLSFGHNAGPITNTTRGILEKKLARFLEGTTSSNGSDQEDVDVAKTNRRSSTGRRSISRKFAPYSSDEEDFNRTPENSKKSVRSEVKSSKNEFVDPNDVLITPSAKNSHTANVRSRSQNRRSSSQNSLTPSSVVSKPVTTPPNTSSINNTESKAYRPLKSLRNEFSDDELSTTKELSISNVDSRKSITTPTHSVSTSHMDKNNETENTNHIKDNNRISDQSTNAKDESMSKRTSTSRNTSTSRTSPINIKLPDMQDEINESLKELRKSYTSKRPSPNAKQVTIDDIAVKDEDEEIDAEFVPKVSYMRLLKDSITWYKIVSLIIVFIFVGLYLYNGAGNDIPSISGSDKESSKLKHYHIINCFYQRLSVLAGDAECGRVKDKWVKKASLRGFAKPCLIDGDTFDNVNFTAYADFFAINENGDVSSKFAYRSLGCRVNQAVSVVMIRAIMIVTALACSIGGYFIMKKRWADDDEQTRQILHFVERIIETLQRHHEVCQTNKDLPSFLPIPHVRDMLIPLAKRKQMAKTWRKAVAFLNSSDSRVRVETQRIAGEDFDVWRWIGVSTPKLKKEKKATSEKYLSNDHEKCWQGPAFDAIEKVVRMPIVTPTPCLKIRYMHEGVDEKGEEWVKRVENAVLEKCSQVDAQILHIDVDKSSKEGCVYVKCDSLESAGKAFRSMYGNWFDSRLVIVKFVTLARYHQRFPDALNRVDPLQHDKDCRSSLNWVCDE